MRFRYVSDLYVSGEEQLLPRPSPSETVSVLSIPLKRSNADTEILKIRSQSEGRCNPQHLGRRHHILWWSLPIPSRDHGVHKWEHSK